MLFVGAGGSSADVDAHAGRSPLADRRSPIERREADDRRVFPPRPEGRRLGGGRRAGDARD
jgi:hypothetical protein